MSNKIIWETDEIKYVEDNWRDKTDDEISKIINKSPRSIKTLRQNNGWVKFKKSTKTYSYEEVKNIFNKRGYILVSSRLKKQSEKLDYVCIKHKEHGIQQISLCDILRGRGCMYCGREKAADAKKKKDEYYINECLKLNLTYVGRHVDEKHNITVIEFMCNKHIEVGVQYKYINNLKKGTGCPYCHTCRNENDLYNILSSWNYNFISQKRFKDCKDKNPLPFDFYLTDFNILIEFDGEFHYRPIKKGNMTEIDAVNQLERIKRHDKIKDEYCKNNNIPLIRIPYWEKDNLEHFLWDKLVDNKAIIENN